jgi:phage baseplate assembly protein W
VAADGIGGLVGRGIAFPPGVGPDGRVRWSEGEQNVREAIEIVLRTERRERLGAELGAGLRRRFLFEPGNAATHRRLEEEIAAALSAWEPRVSVESVSAAPDRADPEAASVEIVYRLVSTGGRQQLDLTVPLGPAGGS